MHRSMTKQRNNHGISPMKKQRNHLVSLFFSLAQMRTMCHNTKRRDWHMYEVQIIEKREEITKGNLADISVYNWAVRTSPYRKLSCAF